MSTVYYVLCTLYYMCLGQTGSMRNSLSIMNNAYVGIQKEIPDSCLWKDCTGNFSGLIMQTIELLLSFFGKSIKLSK